MKALHGVAFVLLIIGGLNWLVLTLFSWDISQIFGGMDSGLTKVVYVLIGLSAIYLAITHKTTCKYCMKGGEKM
ncbi:MAG: uncharacterized protein QOG91_485 [Candidatus Parcubacteria bacterium]|jgi:uncharacterized membrane protein YuzA (DUF378 family)|nr:uncharacterized protein [Candidatus Parcubacteria bacterium]